MKKLLEILEVAPELGQFENIFWFDDCKHLDTTETLDSEVCRDCGLEV